MLHKIALSSSENPLHIASLAGHVDFVREILRLKPEFAKLLNQDSFSPIHMASANGYLEIVRELLKVDRGLCRIEGRNKWTPLHFAASRGRSDIIAEMLLVCPESIEDVTVQKETALHLAVKNSQFVVVDLVLRWIRDMKKDEILNMRDESGNSVLHLATWRKHHQVVEWLLSSTGPSTSSAPLNVNAVNRSGLTALDVLLIFPSEAGDREIEELLRDTGARRAKDMVLSVSSSFEPDTNQALQSHCESESADDLVEYFKFKKGRDSPSDARSALLVMAVLVATATFQVGINPPSGIWQDSDLHGNGTTPAHEAGRSILGSYSSVTYLLFVIFNSTGLSVSLYMLAVLTSGFPMQLEFQICAMALYFTYNTALATMAPEGTTTFIIVFSAVVPSTTRYFVKLVGLLIRKLKIILSYLFHRVT